MSSVTVPGTGGSIITVTTNGTATHLIAQQIANALAAAGSRAVTTTGSGGRFRRPPQVRPMNW